MKLIVGLGNPGTQYDKTRHNAGFFVVDELLRRHDPAAIAKSRFNAAVYELRLGTDKCLLLKPTTFMNLSGRCVGEAIRFFKLDPEHDLVVLLDEIALPVGHIRVRASGGTAGHNGLKDIDRVLGNAPYARVRLGVGKAPSFMSQSDWVLSRFTDEEQDDVTRSVSEAASAVELWISDGPVAAMNRFNKRLPADKPRRERKRPGTAGPETSAPPAPKRNKSTERSNDAASPDNHGPAEDSARPPRENERDPANDDMHPGWTAGD